MIRIDKLRDVLEIEADAGLSDLEILDLTQDSRELEPGWMFACVNGESSDGHDFVSEAEQRGAVALLVERNLSNSLPQLLVKDVRASMAVAAAAVHEFPSKKLCLVGVTGTSGKTTVTTILGQLLCLLGEPSKVIGTLSGARTTPEAPKLQRQLAQWRDQGIGTVAIEVSSHALVQNRVDSLFFDVGVFMNLSAEHLDYHSTMQDYFKAKSKLFIEDRVRESLICIDDEWGRELVEMIGPQAHCFAIDDAKGLQTTAKGATYEWRGQQVDLGLPGAFNVVNALAASETALLLGYKETEIAQALGSVRPVRGRMEPITEGQSFRVVVDYAHKPAALEMVLREAAGLISGKLFVVFGCGGDRDSQKRPEMGSIAAEIADQVVVTSDNPRGESPEAIISEIIAGIPSTTINKVKVVPDRAEAISSALRRAGSDDLVVIAGKGHETTQVFSDRVIEFDDRLVARRVLRELLKESQ